MLGSRDSVVLAMTKLRTRRIRLIVTLVVSGILFSVLVFMSLFANGLIQSVESFTKDAYYDRYFVSANGTGFTSRIEESNDQKYVKRAIEIYNAQLVKKTAEAKSLGIEFNPATDPKPYQDNPDMKGSDGKSLRALDTSHPAAQQAILELSDTTSLHDRVKKVLSGYGAINAFSSTNFGSNWFTGSQQYELTPIIRGKEQVIGKGNNGMSDPIMDFGSSLSTFDDSMMKPFLLNGTSTDAKAGDPIPVLAPIDAVEKILGVATPSKKATASEKIAHLSAIRSKAANVKFSVCYRNSAAVAQRSSAEAQVSEIASQKSTPGYELPSVVYGPPTEACQPTLIAKDTRTAEQKQYEGKVLAFEQRYGQQAPVTQLIEFKIVGLLPKSGYGDYSGSIEGIISNILTPSFGVGWRASDQAVSTNPILNAIKNDPMPALLGGASASYIEFSNRADQKRFIDKFSCQASEVNSCTGSNDMFLMAWGNPLAILSDADHGTKTAIRWLVGILAGISALVMMGTIGKVVADSRKETSVFRALGARRRDIVQIYSLYTLILGLMAFGMALLIGIMVALYIDYINTGNLSAMAVLALNASDVNKEFHLFGWSPKDMLYIAGLVVITSLASAVFPLLGNIRRNPVKDMREE